MIVSVAGLRVSLRDRGEDGYLGDRAAFAQVFFAGEYDFLLARTAPGDIVLDAGANIGCFALRASRQVGARGIVIAVEPEPGNVARLRANIQLNDITNMVVVERALDSVHNRKVNIVGTGTTARVESLGSPGYPRDPTGGSARTAVKTTTLDDLVRELSLGRLDVIKMDIEGSENSIFETTSTSAAMATAKAVAVEVHDRYGPGVVQGRLRAEGYTYVGEVKPESGFLSRSLRYAIRRPDLVLRLYGTEIAGVVVRMVLGALRNPSHAVQHPFGTVYAAR